MSLSSHLEMDIRSETVDGASVGDGSEAASTDLSQPSSRIVNFVTAEEQETEYIPLPDSTTNAAPEPGFGLKQELIENVVPVLTRSGDSHPDDSKFTPANLVSASLENGPAPGTDVDLVSGEGSAPSHDTCDLPLQNFCESKRDVKERRLPVFDVLSTTFSRDKRSVVSSDRIAESLMTNNVAPPRSPRKNDDAAPQGDSTLDDRFMSTGPEDNDGTDASSSRLEADTRKSGNGDSVENVFSMAEEPSSQCNDCTESVLSKCVVEKDSNSSLKENSLSDSLEQVEHVSEEKVVGWSTSQTTESVSIINTADRPLPENFKNSAVMKSSISSAQRTSTPLKSIESITVKKEKSEERMKGTHSTESSNVPSGGNNISQGPCLKSAKSKKSGKTPKQSGKKSLRVTGAGAQDLPSNLSSMLSTLHCSVCPQVSIEAPESALSHYNSRKHQLALKRQGLGVGCFHVTGSPLLEKQSGETVVKIPSRNLNKVVSCKLCKQSPNVQQSGESSSLENSKQKTQSVVCQRCTERPEEIQKNVLSGPGHESLPENLRELLERFHCSLCHIDVNTPVAVSLHYNSSPHQMALTRHNLQTGHFLLPSSTSVQTRKTRSKRRSGSKISTVVFVPKVGEQDTDQVKASMNKNEDQTKQAKASRATSSEVACKATSSRRKLVGEGVSALPPNLREILCKLKCNLCSLKIMSTSSAFMHYNGPIHQMALSRANLMVGRVRLSAPSSEEKENGEKVIRVPKAIASPLFGDQKVSSSTFGGGSADNPVDSGIAAAPNEKYEPACKEEASTWDDLPATLYTSFEGVSPLATASKGPRTDANLPNALSSPAIRSSQLSTQFSRSVGDIPVIPFSLDNIETTPVRQVDSQAVGGKSDGPDSASPRVPEQQSLSQSHLAKCAESTCRVLFPSAGHTPTSVSSRPAAVVAPLTVQTSEEVAGASSESAALSAGSPRSNVASCASVGLTGSPVITARRQSGPAASAGPGCGAEEESGASTSCPLTDSLPSGGVQGDEGVPASSEGGSAKNDLVKECMAPSNESLAMKRMSTDSKPSSFGPSKRAKKAVELVGSGVSELPKDLEEMMKYNVCSVCNITVFDPMDAVRHFNSKDHQERGQMCGRTKQFFSFSRVRILTTATPGVVAVEIAPRQAQASISSKDSGVVTTRRKLIGEGVSDLPPDLQELLSSSWCNLCSLRIVSPTCAFLHYNGLIHQRALSREKLMLGHVRLSAPISQATENGEKVLHIPKAVASPLLDDENKTPSRKEGGSSGKATDAKSNTSKEKEPKSLPPKSSNQSNQTSKPEKQVNPSTKSSNQSSQSVKQTKPVNLPNPSKQSHPPVKQAKEANPLPKFSNQSGQSVKRAEQDPSPNSNNPSCQPPKEMKQQAVELVGAGAGDLPENLREVLTSLQCLLCKTSFSFPLQAIAHYNGKQHRLQMEKFSIPYRSFSAARVSIKANGDRKFCVDVKEKNYDFRMHELVWWTTKEAAAAAKSGSSCTTSKATIPEDGRGKTFRLSKENKTFCEVCQVPCNSERSYQDHLRGRAHHRAQTEASAAKRGQKRPLESTECSNPKKHRANIFELLRHCVPCFFTAATDGDFNLHLRSREHLKRTQTPPPPAAPVAAIASPKSSTPKQQPRQRPAQGRTPVSAPSPLRYRGEADTPLSPEPSEDEMGTR